MFAIWLNILPSKLLQSIGLQILARCPSGLKLEQWAGRVPFDASWIIGGHQVDRLILVAQQLMDKPMDKSRFNITKCGSNTAKEQVIISEWNLQC